MSSTAARPPRLFLAAIGDEHDGYYQVRWEGGELTWSFRDETERLRPDDHAWRLFWRAVEMNGVWDWRERYERAVADDGTSRSRPHARYWLLELEVPGRKLSSSGANAYPPGPRGSAEPTREFNRFCAAVSRLAGGRRFG